MKVIWQPLEHRFRAEWGNLLAAKKWTGQRLLIAVSGGADSVALTHLLHRLRPFHGGELALIHLHHGESLSGAQTAYRDRAQSFVVELAAQLQIPLHCQKYEGPILRSEEQFRQFRRANIRALAQQISADWTVLGHQAQDLLETRLLRLLRGTGPQGLEAMRPMAGVLLRPLLSFSRTEILAYLKQIGAQYCEDPSNSDLHYRRNWLRHRLLPLLESEQAGSTKAMARSLELLVESLRVESWPEGLWTEKGLSLRHWQALSVAQQKQALAQYLLRKKMRHFRHTQIQEIQKRLDISQIGHSFDLAGLHWTLKAREIVAEKKLK